MRQVIKKYTRDKSFAFAVRIAKLYSYLRENKKEFVLSEQLLRSGTAIGANIREAYNLCWSGFAIAELYLAKSRFDYESVINLMLRMN